MLALVVSIFLLGVVIILGLYFALTAIYKGNKDGKYIGSSRRWIRSYTGKH